MDNTKVALVFVCDDGYVMPTSVAITSLIANKHPNTIYEIYIIGDNLSIQNIHYFEKLEDDFTHIHVLPSTENIEEFDCSNTNSIYMVATKAALLKFSIAELLTSESKAIYLDGDIIVKGDLLELFNTDISDYYAAVVRDVPQVLFDKPLIDTGSGRDYFNSGVMLLNLELLRKEQVKDTLIATKKSLTNDTLMDQNVFNIVFKDRVLQLPVKYNILYANLLRSWENHNVLQRLNNAYNSNYRSLDDIFQNGVIIHFSSPDKPWKYFDAPLADEWLYYYIKSPFGEVPLFRGSINEENVVINTRKCFPVARDKKARSIVPIVFATDANYVPYTVVAIQSIIENSNQNYFYDIYVLHSNLSSSDTMLFDSMSCNNVEITCVNVEKISQQIDRNFYVRAHYSKEMYYRWFIPEILPQYNKVLYLDCDVVTLRDVSTLYNTEMNPDNIIGGITNICDPFTRYRVNKHFSVQAEQYINSGILLFNTKAFILSKTKFECLRLTSIIAESILICPDQDIINVACKDKIQYLDDTWNFQWHHQWDKPDQKIDSFVQRFEAAKNNIGIIHFTSGIKPWKDPSRPLAYYFWKYARVSPIYEAILYKNLSLSNYAGTASQNVQPCNNSSTQEQKNISNSKSYKIGRIITFIPRKIRGGIRCYKEHGLSYTWDRVLVHLHLKKDPYKVR